jgi:outer membrane lipoprotein LolB
LTLLRHLIGIGMLGILLAGCGNQSTKPDLPVRPARETISRFGLDGRMAISQAGRSNTLRITWEHTPASDLIGFASPLGNQLAELQRDAQGARWTSADGERREAGSADQLMARLTETPVPLDSLALWVLGRVGSQAEVIQRDPFGRLLIAVEQAWTVRITSYENDSVNALPATLEAERPGLRVKLAIEAWQP